jgi:putative hydrolase of the HAD superfamily
LYKNIKHIFFDLDDTLWDFERNSFEVLQQLYLEFQLDLKLKSSFEKFFAVYKKINADLWNQYSKGNIDKQYLRNHRFDLTFKAFSYHNFQENLLLTQQYILRAPFGKHLKNGCTDILSTLKKKYTLHIITNGFKEIQNIKIDHCDLRQFFSQIIIGEEHQLTKPNEKLFRICEKLTQSNKEECLMIGDSFESDILGALNAGWKAVWLNNDNIPPLQSDKQYSNINELAALLRYL